MHTKYILIILLIMSLGLVACEEGLPENVVLDESQLQACQKNNECVPLPSDCHPNACINKQYESYFPRPEACTLVFDLHAAYTLEDCLCQENLCVNKNIN